MCLCVCERERERGREGAQHYDNIWQLVNVMPTLVLELLLVERLGNNKKSTHTNGVYCRLIEDRSWLVMKVSYA